MIMNNRAPLPYLTAYLQFTIAIMFMLGYFGFLAILFLGHVTIQSDLLELGKTLAVGLSGALGLLFAFLYLRSREQGTPDPGTTTSTVSSTSAPSAPLAASTITATIQKPEIPHP
jgi:hypothetical protein